MRRRFGAMVGRGIGALIAILAAVPIGCSSPWLELARDPCLPGNVRVEGVCVLSPHALSPEAPDASWDDLPAAPLDFACSGCALALPASLAAALGPGEDPVFALRVRLADGAAPVTSDPDLRYVVELTAPPAFPHRAVDRLLATSGGLAYEKAGAVVELSAGSASAVGFAWRSDGFAASVPWNLIGFRGGVTARAYVERFADGRWAPVGPPPAGRALCERTARELDPCGVVP